MQGKSVDPAAACPLAELLTALAQHDWPGVEKILADHGLRLRRACPEGGGVPLGKGLGCLSGEAPRACLEAVAALFRLAFAAYEREGVFAGLPFPVLVLDSEGRLVAYNRAAAEAFGIGEGDLGRPHPLVPPERRAEFAGRMRRYAAGEHLGPLLREWQGRRYLVQALPIPAPDGSLWRLVDLWVDVAPVAGEEAFHLAVIELIREVLAEGVGPAFFERILELARRFVPGAEAGSILVRKGEVFRYAAVWNYPSGLVETAIPVAESWDRRAQGPEILRPPPEKNPALRLLGRAAEIKEVLHVPVVVRGEVKLSLNLDAFRTGAFRREDLRRAEELAGLLGLLLEWREKTEEAEYHAYHDVLTGLPNERFWNEVGEEVVQRMAGEAPVSVIAVDVARLHAINDALSHAAGDRLLYEVARRLEATLFAGDLVVRTAGGEFAALLLRCDREGAERAMRRLIGAMQAPVRLAGRSFAPEVRLGVAVAENGGDLAELWTRARLALSRAKEEGRSYAFYDPEREERRRREARLEVELKEALAAGALALFVQPVWDLVQERFEGGEVLLRWKAPPSRFIPLAEQRGLGPELDRYVLERAGPLARRLGMRLWVNLLPSSLAEPGFASEVVGRANPEWVGLEVTEYALLSPIARENLEALAAAGFPVALDDFGTGYASLALLTELPLFLIKLDRSLIARFDDPKVRALLRGVLQVARDLGLRPVAEGVEDRALLPALRELGFRYAQGFALARPEAAGSLSPRSGSEEA